MCETYSGWTNRETWALMLWVNNDEGLQSEARDVVRGHYRRAPIALEAWAETLFTRSGYVDEFGGPWPDGLADAAEDIGSLYRVNWQECAESILRDVAELDNSDALA
jgi:hypothetical protein